MTEPLLEDWILDDANRNFPYLISGDLLHCRFCLHVQPRIVWNYDEQSVSFSRYNTSHFPNCPYDKYVLIPFTNKQENR